MPTGLMLILDTTRAFLIHGFVSFFINESSGRDVAARFPHIDHYARQRNTVSRTLSYLAYTLSSFILLRESNGDRMFEIYDTLLT